MTLITLINSFKHDHTFSSLTCQGGHGYLSKRGTNSFLVLMSLCMIHSIENKVMRMIFLSLIISEYIYNRFLPNLGIIYNHILDSSDQIYTIISLILAIKFVLDYTQIELASRAGGSGWAEPTPGQENNRANRAGPDLNRAAI